MARTQGSRADITGPLVREHSLRLFARHGYAAVSMRQIAATVGVQAGALYAYTPDKQALLANLLTDHMENLLAAWKDGPDAPPLERLEAFVRFHIAYSLDHADAVFLSYMELRNLSPENHAAVSALRRAYEESLSAILRERGPLSPSETMSIVGQTALALQAAHERGVIHRDVKPGNLMITPDGRVKVTDFGIARATDEVPLTQTGTVLGTSYYLAPEQAAGEEVDARCDLYSLGVVTYQALAGRLPYEAASLSELVLKQQR